MTEQEAQDRAYRLLAVSMPASWMEADGKMRPKAVKVRDYLARALMDAFEEGVESMVDSIDGG